MQTRLRDFEAADDGAAAAGGAADAGAAALAMLVIGAEDAAPPNVQGVTYVTEPEKQFDCVALIDSVSPARAQAALAAARNLLAPVALFGFFEGTRADFSAPSLTPVTMQQAIAVLRPIRDRLVEIPSIEGTPDQDGLLVLGFAHTRRKSIEAEWRPAEREAVGYPLLGAAPAMRRQLESLAELGLLHRRFFKRTNICGRCASSRLCAYEACMQCGCGQLNEEEIIHHYACGHEAAQSGFLRDRDLICPKCKKELRHFGVDYDKPGVVVACRDCGKVMAEPRVAFDCLDCGHTTPGDGIETTDWYHYDLAADGVAALLEGRLPHLDFAELLAPQLRTYPLRDFVLLTRESLRVAARYDRPFSMMSVAVTNREALGSEHGAARTAAAFRLMVDVFAESVREADLVAVGADQTVLIALPETSAEHGRAVARRFEDAVTNIVDLPIALHIRVEEGEAAVDLVEANS